MSRFTTNAEVMVLFETIDSIKQNETITEVQKNKAILKIQNKMIQDLSFLVYSNAKYYRRFSNYEDLVQEGFIGLLRSVRKFNYKMFPNFFVYSERWIKHCIRKAASRFDVVYCPNRTRVVYAEPIEAGVEEIDPGPEEKYITKETVKIVKEELSNFSDREKDVVERIFGLDDQDPQTLRAIGPKYNLTHERIRQIKNQVIDKLKNNERLGALY